MRNMVHPINNGKPHGGGRWYTGSRRSQTKLARRRYINDHWLMGRARLPVEQKMRQAAMDTVREVLRAKREGQLWLARHHLETCTIYRTLSDERGWRLP